MSEGCSQTAGTCTRNHIRTTICRVSFPFFRLTRTLTRLGRVPLISRPGGGGGYVGRQGALGPRVACGHALRGLASVWRRARLMGSWLCDGTFFALGHLRALFCWLERFFVNPFTQRFQVYLRFGCLSIQYASALKLVLQSLTRARAPRKMKLQRSFIPKAFVSSSIWGCMGAGADIHGFKKSATVGNASQCLQKTRLLSWESVRLKI